MNPVHRANISKPWFGNQNYQNQRLLNLILMTEPFQKTRLYGLSKQYVQELHIEYQGNVIVFGDVNPGAEIMAGGSVLIWGRLRGLVHAGADGDEEAIVGALEFSPMQLRIAGKIAVSPKKNSKGKLEIRQDFR